MINTFITSVDDNEATCMMMQELLEMTGEDYVIEQFSSGPQFIKRLDKKSKPIDIAILDMHMPGFDIIEAVEKIDTNFPLTYVIVVSGDNDPEIITKLQNKYHIWGYVIKMTTEFEKDLIRLVGEAHRKTVIRKGLLDEG